MYQGDYVEDATVDFKFTTTSASTGAPTQLAGTPAVSVYKANGTTESTAGVTLTVDFDTRTGLNHVRIDTSADAFYAVANDYQVVITTGTVGGTSAVGYVVGEFSIENRNDRNAADDALVAINLDHWFSASINMDTDVADNSGYARQVTSSGDASDYVQSTDSQEAAANQAISNGNDLGTLTASRGEPAQGAPPASTTFYEKIDYLYKVWRNRKTQTATQKSYYADDGTTVDHKATVSDNGTTYDDGEVASGP